MAKQLPKALPISGGLSIGGPGFMLMAKELGWSLPYPLVLAIGIGSIIALAVSAILSIVWAWRWLKEQRDPNSSFNTLRIAARRNVIPIVLGAVGIVGIVLICVAGVGAYYHYADQPKQAEDKKPASTTVAPEEPKPLKRMLTAYDVEQRLRAIDQLLGELDDKVLPASAEAEKLNQSLFDRITAGTAIGDLDAHVEHVKTALAGYLKIAARYDHFRDIVIAALGQDWSPQHIENAASLLRAELQEMQQRGQMPHAADYLRNNKLLADWRGLVSGKFWTWINQRREELRARRKEYEQAEVYPAQKSELPADKRDMIKRAREFVTTTVRTNKDYGYFKDQLLTDSVYFELKPHLSAGFRKIASGRMSVAVVGGSNIPGIAVAFLGEIDRLEKEWSAA
jgi:hypothetical protein